jgi:hypothetical protein
MTRRPTALVAATVLAAVLAAGAGAARGGLADLVDLGTRKANSVLRAPDLLVEAGKEANLVARLGAGVRPGDFEGKRIQFFLDDALLGEARTAASGDAALRWKVPEKPADYRIRVRLNPEDQPPEAVAETEMFAAARPKDARIVITDLDKTVVASGFLSVLAGQAKPMPGAGVVLQRLAKDHTIVYLTQRPDFLGASSKRWLAENGFPPGALLTTTLQTLVEGSGAYKAARLAEIKKTFPNVAVGIGDKPSDAKAYADNGAQAVLILNFDWSQDGPERYEKTAAELAALPDSVQVVTNWAQIASILFEKAAFPKQDMEKRLRDTARELRDKGRH